MHVPFGESVSPTPWKSAPEDVGIVKVSDGVVDKVLALSTERSVVLMV